MLDLCAPTGGALEKFDKAFFTRATYRLASDVVETAALQNCIFNMAFAVDGDIRENERFANSIST